MRYAFLLIFTLLAPLARADIVLVTWTNPTTYSDSTALPASDITRTRVEYGTNTGPVCGFGTRIADVIANGSATSVSTPNLPIGTYAFRAFTTAKGVESVASNVACRSVVQAAPNPPSAVTVTVTITVGP